MVYNSYGTLYITVSVHGISQFRYMAYHSYGTWYITVSVHGISQFQYMVYHSFGTWYITVTVCGISQFRFPIFSNFFQGFTISCPFNQGACGYETPEQSSTQWTTETSYTYTQINGTALTITPCKYSFCVTVFILCHSIIFFVTAGADPGFFSRRGPTFARGVQNYINAIPFQIQADVSRFYLF